MTEGGPRGDDLSRMLEAVGKGEPGSKDRLLDLVYGELRKMAHNQMARERGGHLLQTTALVNEAYLRMFGKSDPTFENRRHFFGAAARAMRRILVDHAKSVGAIKRGAGFEHVAIDGDVADTARPEVLLALDDALTGLARDYPDHAEIVCYRYFLGFTIDQTSEILGVATGTVSNRWTFAQAWLRRAIDADPSDDAGAHKPSG